MKSSKSIRKSSVVTVIFSSAILTTGIMLSGCSKDDGHDHDHDAMHAPVLKSIGDHNVVVNRAVEINLAVTDDEAHQHNWIAEGIAGEPNPLTQEPPAVFDASTGIFTWTTTDIEEDDYLIRFTVADFDNAAAHDDEIIQISVISSLKNGEIIATTICSGCHGDTLNGISQNGSKTWGPNIQKATADRINLIRSTKEPMKSTPLVANLSDVEIDDVAEYLATLGN